MKIAHNPHGTTMIEKEFVWPTQYCPTCKEDKIAALHFTPGSKSCRECRKKWASKERKIPAFYVGFMKGIPVKRKKRSA